MATTGPRRKQQSLYPRGTYARVARELQVTAQHVRLVALGNVTSARVSAALARVVRRSARSQAQESPSEAGRADVVGFEKIA